MIFFFFYAFRHEAGAVMVGMAGMLSVGDDCGQNDECNTTHGGKVMVFF